MLFLPLIEITRAEPVAQIVAVDGTAVVDRADGLSVVASVQVELDRRDVVRTDADGAVIVLLANSRLVRIDEELSLRVDDIALLAAPATAAAPADQLAGLLYPGERARMRGIEDVERISGWHARMSAATAVPAQAPPLQQPDDAIGTDLIESDADGRSGLGKGGGGSGGIGLGATGTIGHGSGSGSGSGYGVGAGASIAALTPDRIAAELSAGGELAACMRAWRKETGLAKGTRIDVVLRVSDGTIERLVGERGLTLPICARAELEGASVVATDGETATFVLP